jgi:hypothetical protein
VREVMLLILIRTFYGTFLWGVCECTLFIAMQYRKLETELYILGKDNITERLHSTTVASSVAYCGSLLHLFKELHLYRELNILFVIWLFFVLINFSLIHHRVQNGSGAYPASYPMGTRGSFPGGQAAGP